MPQNAGRPRPRTIAAVAAGPNPIPPAFLTAFAEEARRRDSTLILSAETVGDAIGAADLNSLAATRALNALERTHDTIVFLTGPDLDGWSEKALHQAA